MPDTGSPEATDPSDPSEGVTGGGLPVAPDLETEPEGRERRKVHGAANRRLPLISALACLVALAAGLAAQLLTALIALITNIAFYGRVSLAWVPPSGNHLSGWVLVIPVAGAVLVGLLARYGHAGIRGHGIPEAMEQILTNRSRIPARLTILKPLSAAIAIGTGGPFGAEGPIIATGGALGSVLGQLLRITAVERKVLLAAGAAAGMAATFGSPVAAVLLAMELLLFEYRARSIIPVALAAAVATGVRVAFVGSAPVFAMPSITEPHDTALIAYVGLGGLVGLVAVWVTEAVYWVEDRFEQLPVHWMWWPAIGAVAVGAIGWIEPQTLGVGYENIRGVLAGSLGLRALLLLGVLKFLSWVISLGSGTSGGTMAPLFTMGGALGAAIGVAVALLFPRLGLDPRVAGLVGMAAMFAGASRAFLASVIMAFETTRQPLGLLPLLGGCTAAVLVSYLVMRDTIMTRKIERRGIRVVSEYEADYLGRVFVRQRTARPVVSLRASDTLARVRAWLASSAAGSQHQGFPVVDEGGRVTGVLTRRDLLAAGNGEGPSADATVGSLIRRPAVTITEDASLRDAADRMVLERVGRLVVVTETEPDRAVGMITRSDLLEAHGHRLEESHYTEQSLDLRALWAD